jgi:hypothetical protein
VTFEVVWEPAAVDLCSRFLSGDPDGYHFSEDPSIERFVPHVPRTNPAQLAAVWAIEAEHAPLYWYPRDCPRITAWPRNPDQVATFQETWSTTADRVHAIESVWLDRIRTVTLYRYDLPAAPFQPWPDAQGQWITHSPVVPEAIQPVGDLLALHATAQIELRVTPSLWPLSDLAQSGPWMFSIVRMLNAVPRPN